MNRFKPPEFAGRLHPRNLSADFLDFFRQGMTRLSLDHLSHRIKWHVRSKILDQLVKQLLVGGGRLKRIHVTKLIRQRVIFFGQIRSDVLDEIIDSILGCIKYRGARTLAILTSISANEFNGMVSQKSLTRLVNMCVLVDGELKGLT